MKNTRKKILIFIVVCFIILIFLLSIIPISKKKKSVPFDPILDSDINTIEDLCAYYKIKLIEEIKPDTIDDVKQIFVEFPYDTKNKNGTSSRNFYEDVIYKFAKVYDYDDILVLDDSKAIKIDIKCYKTSKSVKEYTINDDKNYFENLEKKLNSSNISKTELKDIEVKSDIIKKLIKNSWNENSVSFGTKECDLDNYEVYFDEGIEVRKINGKIFNIVFNQKYDKDILEGVNTKTSLEEIIKKYGESTFKNIVNFVGYKTKDFYIFFNGEQISIYRVEVYNTEEFSKLFTNFIESKNEKEFVEELKKLWPDYDEYTVVENRNKIILKYTLKGIEFNINVSREHGIHLYNNFDGKITNDVTYEQIIKSEKELPNYTYIEKKDLVYKYELDRNYGVHNFKTNLESYEYSYNDLKSKNLITQNDTEKTDFFRQSSKFFCKKNNLKLMVFSRTNEYPPFEIDNNYCFVWFDDTHLIYSIFKQGIYMYNAVTREVKTITEGNGPFKINGIDKDGFLDYDDDIIDCNID